MMFLLVLLTKVKEFIQTLLITLVLFLRIACPCFSVEIVSHNESLKVCSESERNARVCKESGPSSIPLSE